MKHLAAKASRWRLLITGGIALTLILMATLVGLASMMFPWLLSHPERVESFLSTQLDRPVRFERIAGEWRARGPIFSLEGLQLGARDGAENLQIGQAELAFDFYAFLHRGRSWYSLNIVAPSIDLALATDGRWQLRQWAGREPFDLSELRSLGAIGMRDARISLSDVATGRSLKLVDAELSITEGEQGRRLFARLRPESGTVPMQLACDLDAGFGNGRCYLRGQGLLSHEWLADWPIASLLPESGALDLQAWVDLDDFAPKFAHAELRTAEITWRSVRAAEDGAEAPRAQRLKTDPMQLSLRWQRAASEGWRLDLLMDADAGAKAAGKLSKLSWWHTDAGTPGAIDRLQVEALQLPRLLPWVALGDWLPERFADLLKQTAPVGEVHDVIWQRTGSGAVWMQAGFRGLGIDPALQVPGIVGLGGVLHGDEQAMVVNFDELDSQLIYPNVFRAPLDVHLAPLRAVIIPTADQTSLRFENLKLIGNGFEISGQVGLDFVAKGGLPIIDAVVQVQPSDVVAAKQVWPINVMSPRTIQWLDGGLRSGRVDRGIATIRGDLDDWPFEQQQGRFDAVADISDADVEFHPDWPIAELHSARVQFVNRGIWIEIAEASLQGNQIRGASAHIENTKHPELVVVAESVSTGAQLLDLVRNSALQKKLGRQLDGVVIEGRADAAVTLKLELGPNKPPASVVGRVALHDADLRDDRWNLKFDQASGNLQFTESGFNAESLSVRMQEHVAELSIAMGQAVVDEAHQLEASLRGELPVAALLSGRPGMDTLINALPGTAHWDAVVLIADDQGAGAAQSSLVLRSDLRGIAINLPAPLRKDAATAMPFEGLLSLPLERGRVRLKLGQLARFRGQLPVAGQGFSGHLALGGGLADSAPESGLRISGEVPAIDLSGWAGLGAGSGASGLPLEADVRAEEVGILGRAFDNTRVRIDTSVEGMLVRFDGADIDGELELTSGASKVVGIAAKFKTLHWPEASPSTQSQSIDPSNVPPLHIWVGDLRLGAARLGEARIETRPGSDGMRIEELATRSPTLTLRATGRWSLTDQGEQSALDITFSAEDIGKMLAGLGYGSVIEGGQTVARLNGYWAGTPAQFGLDKVIGTLEGEVGEGRIVDVEPGAGRIFGLVNFSAIPRRLTLDFSDFFQSGLAFDAVKGRFDLNAGDAYTENLLVDAPSAQIKIKGRAGLVARDYDQEMEVVPRVRSALPLVGAVAAGPVGAVIGVLAQDVLRKPLDGIVTARYRVTGTWDQPEVTLIAKEKRQRDTDSKR